MPRPPLDAKRRGEVAELAFLHRAASLGLIVAKPYGDSARYDFLVDDGKRVWKVQVKSSNAEWQGAYNFNSHRACNGRVVPYRAGEVDLIAGYVPRYEAWYLIPWEAIGSIGGLRVYPHRKSAREKYEKYREGWEVFGIADFGLESGKRGGAEKNAETAEKRKVLRLAPRSAALAQDNASGESPR
jgi:hypothetical protein